MEKEIHKKLKLLRKERGVTLTNLADKIGVDYQQLSRIERGKSKLNIQMLMKMAEALETPLNTIVSGMQETFPPKVLPNQSQAVVPINQSHGFLELILEKLEILLEETKMALRPQIKAAITTQIFSKALSMQNDPQSAYALIDYSIEIIKISFSNSKIN